MISFALLRKLAAALSIVICVGYLVIGLWPFSFHPRNNVEWLPDSNGINFKRLSLFQPLSIAHSRSMLDLSRHAANPAGPGEISIELWIEPEEEPWHKIGIIFSLYDGRLPQNLLIGQYKSEILLRARLQNAQDPGRYRDVGAPASLRKGSKRFVVLTSGPGGTVFYLDGSATAIFPKLTLCPETLRGRVVLGDSPQGGSNWVGKLHGLAIFNQALIPQEIDRHYALWKANRFQDLQTEPQLAALYSFDERSGESAGDRSNTHCALSIPKTYQVSQRTYFVMPWKEPPELNDIAVNVLGFIPFGFFFFVYRMQAKPARTFPNAFLTIIVATGISVTIELIQAFLPTRDSSVTDVLCNSFGSLIGLLAAATILSLIDNIIPHKAEPAILVSKS